MHPDHTPTPSPTSPEVRISRLPHVETVEVLRSDLEALVRSQKDGTVAFGFFTTFVGSAGGTVAPALLMGDPVNKTILATTIALAIISGVMWWRQSAPLRRLQATLTGSEPQKSKTP